jgi:ribosomal protein S18 acetylase RimI-like enzyme
MVSSGDDPAVIAATTMPTPFHTRLATLSDVPVLVALVNSAYRGDSSRAGWTTEADMLGGIRIDAERVAASITSEGNVVLVHAPDAVIIACVHLERTGDSCYLGMLTTSPTFQGSGIGRNLIAAAETWAAEHWRSREMHMSVLVQRTELIAWYERRGYIVTGERKPFPYGDERWGLPTRPDLEFHVLTKPLRTESTGDW